MDRVGTKDKLVPLCRKRTYSSSLSKEGRTVGNSDEWLRDRLWSGRMSSGNQNIYEYILQNISARDILLLSHTVASFSSPRLLAQTIGQPDFSSSF